MSDLQHQQPSEAENPEETVAVVHYEPSEAKYSTGDSGEKTVPAPSGRQYHFDGDGDYIPIFAWAKQDLEFFRDYASFEVREL